MSSTGKPSARCSVPVNRCWQARLAWKLHHFDFFHEGKFGYASLVARMGLRISGCHYRTKLGSLLSGPSHDLGPCLVAIARNDVALGPLA